MGSQVAPARDVRLRQLRIDGQGLVGELFGAHQISGVGVHIAVKKTLHGGKPREGRSVFGIEIERRLKVFSRVLQRLRLILMRKKRTADQEFFIRLGILRVAALHRLLILGRQMQVQRFGDFQGHLFLQRKNILQIPGEIVRPSLKAGGGIN